MALSFPLLQRIQNMYPSPTYPKIHCNAGNKAQPKWSFRRSPLLNISTGYWCDVTKCYTTVQKWRDQLVKQSRNPLWTRLPHLIPAFVAHIDHCVSFVDCVDLILRRMQSLNWDTATVLRKTTVLMDFMRDAIPSSKLMKISAKLGYNQD